MWYEGNIVLTVVSSGIVSSLLPSGKTTHSRFRIPINITEDSTCNIQQRSELSKLLHEASMIHRHYFEAIYRSLKDIMNCYIPNSAQLPFGGKSIVLGKDFR